MNYNDIESRLSIKAPSNSMEGAFVLYKTDTSEIDAHLLVYVADKSDLNASLSVRIGKTKDLNSTLEVKYRGSSDISAFMSAMSSTYLVARLEIRPHNQMMGRFELLEAPREDRLIPALQDATTRSRPDLMTVNYGDVSQMMIGQGDGEYFESFVKFDSIQNMMPTLLQFERAKFRLYYNGEIKSGTNIELHLPNANWSELGVTHANKPYSTEKLSDVYTINTVEKYIEFEVMDLLEKWRKGEIENHGLLIKSYSSHKTTFFTKESISNAPSLNVRYITNTVVSAGRSALDSTIFIWGAGNGDLNSTIEVHSDYGFNEPESTIYIHRADTPLDEEVKSTIVISKPDQYAKVTVVRRENRDIDSTIRIAERLVESFDSSLAVTRQEQISALTVDPKMSLESTIVIQRRELLDKKSVMYVSRPDMTGHITIDPNMSLEATMIVNRNEENDVSSSMVVSKPEQHAQLEVSIYRSTQLDVESTILIVRSDVSELSGTLYVSKPDQDATIQIKGIAQSDLSAIFEVPSYEHLESTFAVTRQEIHGFINVHTINDNDSTIYVKHRDDIDATINIHQVNDLNATIKVMYNDSIDSSLAVTRDFMVGYISPRVIGETEIEANVSVKQRDVADLHCTFSINAKIGGYYFIM